MQFTRRLREPVMRGEVTCSVRIWRRPHVKVGGRYPLGPGAIEITSLRQIALSDVTPALARKSGFAGVVDLLKVAKHGAGENVYLVEFVFRAAADTPHPKSVVKSVVKSAAKPGPAARLRKAATRPSPSTRAT